MTTAPLGIGGATRAARGVANQFAAPATKTCPECLEIVPAAARRCRACASAV